MKYAQYIMTVLVMVMVMCGCKKENYAELNKGNTVLALSASVNTVVLQEKNRDNDALILNWTSGSNKGTNASIRYTLQLAKQGTNFANPISLDMGLAVYSNKFSVRTLNDSLRNHFNATPGTVFMLETRIIAQTQVAGISADISPVAVISVTTYQPVTKTLYLIGDAAPNGWDNTKAVALTAIATEPGGFTWT